MNTQILNPKNAGRELLKLQLNAARLPVTAIDRVTRRGQDAGPSPLVMAFETAEVAVKEFAGRFAGDNALLDDARLQRAKLAQWRAAAEQKAVAEYEHEQAQARFEARKQEADEKRRNIEREAQQRQRRLEQDKADAERRVAEAAARQEEAAQKAAHQREQRLAADERAAELRRLEAESAALAEKERALAGEEQATRLDAAAKATKRARKSA